MKKTSRYGFVPYLEMRSVMSFSLCLRVSLIDVRLARSRTSDVDLQRAELFKSHGIAAVLWCSRCDTRFQPWKTSGDPRACYTLSKHVPGGNDLQKTIRKRSVPSRTLWNNSTLWSLRWLQQLPRNTSGFVFCPDAGCRQWMSDDVIY